MCLCITDNNAAYDSIDGCYSWAKETLQVHSHDTRAYLYTRDELEQARTHDDLWNAAQMQMIRDGKMHVRALSCKIKVQYFYDECAIVCRASYVCTGLKRFW